jgi:Flp pilus assembly CpaF family ATPase
MEMNVAWYTLYDPSKKRIRLDPESGDFFLGHGKDCAIRLDSPFIPERAAHLLYRDSSWILIPLVDGLIRIGSESTKRGTEMAVSRNLTMVLRPFTIELEPDGTSEKSPSDPFAENFAMAQRHISQIHETLLDKNKAFILRREPAEGAGLEEDVRKIEEGINSIFADLRANGTISAASVSMLAGLCLHGMILQELSQELVYELSGKPAATKSEVWQKMHTFSQEHDRQAKGIATGFKEKILSSTGHDPEEKLRFVETVFFDSWREHSASMPPYMTEYLASCYLKKEIKDLVFGLGPLEDLVGLANVSEIMVVNHRKIFVEKQGRIQDSGRRFLSEKVAETIIEKIVSKVGKTIDKSRPLADARLMDGSRVNAVIPPLAFTGPCLTIRKFPIKRLTMDSLIEIGSLTQSSAEFLRGAILAKKNIIISGGTGTGKTTLLNILAGFIPDNERIITVEDTVEISIAKSHVIQLEAKENNVEGRGGYTIRDLVKNALRMRPNRIIIGECRGAEALDMLQAMNTGHEGSMTTLHANSSRDAFLRMEVMVQFASTGVSTDSIRKMMGSAINIVLQLERKGKNRQVTQITEVIGVRPGSAEIMTKDLFAFNEGAGSLKPTGHLPTFMGTLLAKHLISEDLFYGIN